MWPFKDNFKLWQAQEFGVGITQHPAVLFALQADKSQTLGGVRQRLQTFLKLHFYFGFFQLSALSAEFDMAKGCLMVDALYLYDGCKVCLRNML